jgi:hypothetical protein
VLDSYIWYRYIARFHSYTVYHLDRLYPHWDVPQDFVLGNFGLIFLFGTRSSKVITMVTYYTLN